MPLRDQMQIVKAFKITGQKVEKYIRTDSNQRSKSNQKDTKLCKSQKKFTKSKCFGEDMT